MLISLRRWGMAVVVALVLSGCGAAAARPEGYVITVNPRPGGLPQENCPPVGSLLEADEGDRKQVEALMPQIAEEWLPDEREPQFQEYEIEDVRHASEAGLRGEHVKVWCGEEVYRSTWIGRLTFPHTFPSNSARNLLFYITKTRDHWLVWTVY